MFRLLTSSEVLNGKMMKLKAIVLWTWVFQQMQWGKQRSQQTTFLLIIISFMHSFHRLLSIWAQATHYTKYAAQKVRQWKSFVFVFSLCYHDENIQPSSSRVCKLLKMTSGQNKINCEEHRVQILLRNTHKLLFSLMVCHIVKMMIQFHDYTDLCWVFLMTSNHAPFWLYLHLLIPFSTFYEPDW